MYVNKIFSEYNSNSAPKLFKQILNVRILFSISPCLVISLPTLRFVSLLYFLHWNFASFVSKLSHFLK